MVWFYQSNTSVYAQGIDDYELPRIGKTVDSIEILYFNLFPKLQKCRSATYKIDNFGNLAFKVLMADGSSESSIISKNSIPEFEKFIVNFENKFNKELGLNWSNLPEFKDHKFKNYEGKGVRLLVSTKDGMFDGEYMYSDNNSLVLWTRDDYYDYSFFNTGVRIIPLANIDKLSVKQGVTNRLAFSTAGLGMGIAYASIAYGIENIGSNAGQVLLVTLGASYLASLAGEAVDVTFAKKREYFVYGEYPPFLRFQRKYFKRSMFPTVAPPEIRKTI